MLSSVVTDGRGGNGLELDIISRTSEFIVPLIKTQAFANTVQCLWSLGWGGAGLGRTQQGIHDPISGGEVRDKFDKFKVSIVLWISVKP